MNLFSNVVMPIGYVCYCFMICVILIPETNAEITVEPSYGPSGMLTKVDFMNGSKHVNDNDWDELKKNLGDSLILFKTTQPNQQKQESSLIQQYFDLLFGWIPCDQSGRENTISQWANEAGYPDLFNSNITIKLGRLPFHL